MKTVEDYLAKIPPLHSKDARFMAELALLLQPLVDQQAFLAALPQAFDLDFAVGVQLDAVGARVGASRQIPIPVENPWFSLGVAGLGLGQGYLKGPYEGSALSKLDDDTFRRLIRAKIVANNSDGTADAVAASLDAYFLAGSDTLVFSYDATDYAGAALVGLAQVDLALVVGVAGKLPTIVDLSILDQELIPIRAAGAALQWAVTTVDGAPVFGLGVENSYIAGLGVGALGASPSFVIENVIL